MKITRLPLISVICAALLCVSLNGQDCGKIDVSPHLLNIKSDSLAITEVMNWSINSEKNCWLQKRTSGYFRDYQYKKALLYATALEHSYQETSVEDSSLIFKNWEILSNAYYEMGLPDSTIYYGKKLLWAMDQRIPELPSSLPRILEIVAMSFADKLQYDLALEWIDLFVYHLLDEGLDDQKVYFEVLYVKGVIKTLQMRMEEALLLMDSISEGSKQYDFKDDLILTRAHTLAIRLNIFVDNIDEVPKQISIAQKLIDSQSQFDTATYVSFLMNSSFYQLILGNSKKEQLLTEKAVELSKVYRKSPVLYSKALLYKAANVADGGDILNGIEQAKRGLSFICSDIFLTNSLVDLKSVFYSFITVQYANNVNLDSSQALLEYEYLWSYRKMLNANMYYIFSQGNKSLSNFDFAPEDLSSIAESIELLWNYSETDSINFDITEAYSFFEKYKSHKINFYNNRKDVFQKKNRDENIRNKENGLRNEIKKLLVHRDTSIFNCKDSYKVLESIIKRREEYESLVGVISTDYTEIYNSIIDLDVVDYSEVQMILSRENETIVSYFIQKENIFILLLNESNVIFEKISINERDEFRRLANSFYKYNSSPQFMEDQTNYANCSLRLYEILIKPIERHLTENVIVVPHDEIYFIPFSALIHSAPSSSSNFKDYNFLLYNYNFSYSPSISSYYLNSAKKIPNGKINGLAVAPIFNSGFEDIKIRSNLFDLKYNVEEAEMVHELISGDLLVGENANIQKINSIQKKFDVLHFATHAIPGGNNNLMQLILSEMETHSYRAINFSDLFERELNTSLIVLSACKSGFGMSNPGEGIISMTSEAFEKGSAIVISNLWNASDYSMKELFSSFYNNAINFKLVSTSLRDSKKEFIENMPNELAHPFYWAGLVVNGYANRQLSKENNYSIYIIIAILLGFYLTRKRLKFTA